MAESEHKGTGKPGVKITLPPAPKKTKDYGWVGIIFVGLIWAAVPWTAKSILLHFQFTHRISHTCTYWFRGKFEAISNIGLWVISFALCFQDMTDLLAKRRARYFLIVLCSSLFYLGLIASEDNRMEREGLPTAVAHAVLNGLPKPPAIQKPDQFKISDFKFLINDHPIYSDKKSSIPMPFQCPGIISLRMENLNKKISASDYFVDVILTDCSIDSDDKRWKPGYVMLNGHRTGALTFYSSAQTQMNPITFKSSDVFPDIKCSCTNPVRGEMKIQVRRADFNFIYGFKFTH